jgi:hypothetical protein
LTLESLLSFVLQQYYQVEGFAKQLSLTDFDGDEKQSLNFQTRLIDIVAQHADMMNDLDSLPQVNLLGMIDTMEVQLMYEFAGEPVTSQLRFSPVVYLKDCINLLLATAIDTQVYSLCAIKSHPKGDIEQHIGQEKWDQPIGKLSCYVPREYPVLRLVLKHN